MCVPMCMCVYVEQNSNLNNLAGWNYTEILSIKLLVAIVLKCLWKSACCPPFFLRRVILSEMLALDFLVTSIIQYFLPGEPEFGLF